MIQFVFRKSVKTRTKTGYCMIIFLENVSLVSCATLWPWTTTYCTHIYLLIVLYSSASFVDVTIYPFAAAVIYPSELISCSVQSSY